MSSDEASSHVVAPSTAAAGVTAVAVSIRRSLTAMGASRTWKTLSAVNQPSGFDCPGCAWPEAAPHQRNRIEFCENGAKAVAEEATTDRVGPEFFAEHSLADLAQRSDYWLGRQGRLTEPMIKRPGDEHYRPIPWGEAHATIAQELKRLDSPDEAVFYTSGRTSNEAAFLYQLLVRLLGTNNLPDCSNMCHESTGVALIDTIGIGKGSVRLEDFASADLILIVGQNPGTNHPRMLATLEEAKRAGAAIVSINPLAEAGTERFKNPQKIRGVVGSGTRLSDLHLPVRLGGDQALFQLWNKKLIESGRIDHRFISESTVGFDAFQRHLELVDAEELLAATGIERPLVDDAFERIASAERLIICWAMGITQHRNAVSTIKEMVNLALIGGHIGRPGAGLCPVRGHSNVQGDRTMGIWERPTPTFLDTMEGEFGVSMPREHGLDVAGTIEAFQAGTAKALICLGGNFLRAIPDTDRAEEALAEAALTVHISTKLNRSHVISGQTALILPTLGRTEVDRQGSGDQFVTVEDSMGLVHASRGVLPPASDRLRSEVAIVTELAEALAAVGLVQPLETVSWADFRNDYDTVRDRISRVVPGFDRFNDRVRDPGGFELPHPPRDRRAFPTPDGSAHFSSTVVAAAPDPTLTSVPFDLLLQTLRSHDQYNTTIYGLDDRYRGISGSRRVVMVNPEDLLRVGVGDGDLVDLVSRFDDGERRVTGFRVVSYDTPVGCAAAYFPETNPLIPVHFRSTESGTPASKSVPISIEPCAGPDAASARHQ